MEKNENGYPQGRATPEANRNGINGATGDRSDTPMDHINKDGRGDGSGNMQGGAGDKTHWGKGPSANGSQNGTAQGRSGTNGTANDKARTHGDGMTDNRGKMNGSADRSYGSIIGRSGTGNTPNGHGAMADECLDGRPLAYVYAPSQRFCMLYSASDALDHGTLFEALYKPMEVYGRE